MTEDALLTYLLTAGRIALFLVGLWIVVWTLLSAIRAFVLPRSERVFLQRLVFQIIFIFFLFRLRKVNSYEDRDRISAMYAPTAVLAMPVFCLLTIVTGYTLMFWATGVTPLLDAFIVSGSSLFTLGFALEPALHHIVLIYSEATIGLGLVALIISYLPTMYGAFSRREQAVAMLEVRAGAPPSAIEMLKRFNRLENLDNLSNYFVEWEEWFAFIEESHTSLAALVFFRSPQPDKSWITAAGVVLDGAALYEACVTDVRAGSQAALCIRAGYIALRRIADFFNLQYDSNPLPTDPISISFDEFAEAYRELADAGVPMMKNLEDAWRSFAGWRVNYDAVLIQLADLTLAPYALWVSDRSLITAGGRPLIRGAFGRFRQRMLRS